MADMAQPARRRRGKYPWGKIAIGESFFVKGFVSHHMASIASAQWHRYGDLYTCRSADGGCHVTRTA